MYIGNLDERVTDALVWELMLQAGRIVSPPPLTYPSRARRSVGELFTDRCARVDR